MSKRRKVPTFTVTRRCDFVANLLPETQCGKVVGQTQFESKARVVAVSLDPNGWVVDNNDLMRVFNRWAEGLWRATCEAIAGGAICGIHELMAGRALEITVTIKPMQLADITLFWEEGMELPSMCPVQVFDAPGDIAIVPPGQVPSTFKF